MRTIIERFEEKYEAVPECGCWLWTGARKRLYGKFGYPQVLAHRASWEIHRYPIPEGLCVLHKCDTPLCVNPNHLFLGTRTDNAADREAKGRGRQGSHFQNGNKCGSMPGEKHPEAKLTDAGVRAIRVDIRSQQAIAMDYGVAQTTISRIKLKQSWANVT